MAAVVRGIKGVAVPLALFEEKAEEARGERKDGCVCVGVGVPPERPPPEKERVMVTPRAS